MITIKNFEIEANFPFSIETDSQGELLLTSGRNITSQGYSNAGGIAINFDIQIENEYIQKGQIAVFQVCKYHNMKVWDSSLNMIKNDLIDDSSGLILDGPNPQQPYYKIHAIEENKLVAYVKYLNKYLFWDAPYVYLEEEWALVNYKIDFQTHICYSDSQNANCKFKKIMFFEWLLEADLKKENDEWKMFTNNFSSNDSIINSCFETEGIFDYAGYANLNKNLHP